MKKKRILPERKVTRIPTPNFTLHTILCRKFDDNPDKSKSDYPLYPSFTLRAVHLLSKRDSPSVSQSSQNGPDRSVGAL
jgi:hypothetical protein